MRNRTVIAGCGILLGLMAWWTNGRVDPVLASGDERSASGDAARGTLVATIDMNKVFKKYAKYQEDWKAVQKEVVAAEAIVREVQREIAQLQARIQTATPGSEDDLRWRGQVDLLTSNLNRDTERQKKEFQQKGAAIMLDAYQVISTKVAKYCKPRGIRMVLRFQDDPAFAQEPNTVLTLANRAIVYQDGLDISDTIIELLNTASPAAGE